MENHQRKQTVSFKLKREKVLEDIERRRIAQWILELCDPKTRERSLRELSYRREKITEMGPFVWHSFGTMAALIQEVMSIYPLLSEANCFNLTNPLAGRVCNALALLQCVAWHSETRGDFVQHNISEFIFPLIRVKSRLNSMEYLRLTSLGVIGALLKDQDNSLGSCKLSQTEISLHLLQNGIIQVCAVVSVLGGDLSKTVTAYIIERLLRDNGTFVAICGSSNLMDTIQILNELMRSQQCPANVRLFSHVLRSYALLTNNVEALKTLKYAVMCELKKETFFNEKFKKECRELQAYLMILQRRIDKDSSFN